MKVRLKIEREGMVGEDGKKNEGQLDKGFIEEIKGLVVMEEYEEEEIRNMVRKDEEYEEGKI